MGRRRLLSESWLREEVEAMRRTQEAQRPRHTYGQIVRNLAFPSWETTAMAGIFLLLSVLLSWLITLLPTYRAIRDLLDIYTAMWQVQAGIAMIVLPFLLLVVELAKDEKQAAVVSVKRGHETPEILHGASWPVQRDCINVGINLPLFIVTIKNMKHPQKLRYVPADLQVAEMFKARNRLRATSKRAGWQGFLYDLAVMPAGIPVVLWREESLNRGRLATRKSDRVGQQSRES